MQFELVDKYVIKARVMPVALTLLPWAAAAVPWMSSTTDPTTVGSGFGLLALAGYALSHVSRRMGKSAEAKLRTKWKSHPTAKFLCWEDVAIDDATKQQIHERLALLTDIKSPSREDEQKDPLRAEEIYKNYAERLRAYALANRKEKDFAIVHAENVDYGFVRNLYGLRWWLFAGIAVAAGSLFFAHQNGQSLIVAGVMVFIAVLASSNACANSVLAASDNYARRLLDASLCLPTK